MTIHTDGKRTIVHRDPGDESPDALAWTERPSTAPNAERLDQLEEDVAELTANRDRLVETIAALAVGQAEILIYLNESKMKRLFQSLVRALQLRFL